MLGDCAGELKTKTRDFFWPSEERGTLVVRTEHCFTEVSNQKKRPKTRKVVKKNRVGRGTLREVVRKKKKRTKPAASGEVQPPKRTHPKAGW